MFKSHIKLRVLKQLNKEMLSGYDLMKYLGGYENKPSPGYIYPLLKDLQKKGFISVKKEKRRKVYSITQKGKNLLKNLENKQREMMKAMVEIGDKREMKEFIKLKSNMKKKNLFIQDGGKLQELHKLIFLIYSDKNDGNIKKMKKILEETIKKLEKLK